MHGVMQCKGSAWLRRSWRSIFDVFKSFLLKRFFNVLTVFKIIFPTFSHLCSSQIRRRCCFKRENSDFWAAAVEVVSWKCLPSTEGDWNAARRPKHRKYLSLCLILNNTEQSRIRRVLYCWNLIALQIGSSSIELFSWSHLFVHASTVFYRIFLCIEQLLLSEWPRHTTGHDPWPWSSHD